MVADKRNLAIIFHSGSYSRIYHGISIALAGAALGREVRLFFTYWALEHLVKGKTDTFEMDGEDRLHTEIIEKNRSAGHMQSISELLTQAKTLGVRIYACTNSMSLLNIARDELVSEVDKSMGITTFLTESGGSEILFI
jgi:peroxiredoxin family protein